MDERRRPLVAGRTLLLLLLAALPAWLFRDVLIGRRVFFTQDVLPYVEPKNQELIDALRERRMPLWLPEIGCGVPFLAEIDNATFNPLNLLLLAGPRRAIELQAPLLLALSALALFALLREWELDCAPAAIGALSYGASGFLVFLFDNPPYLTAAPYVPLLLLCWHRALSRSSPGYVLSTAAVAALCVTTGDLETVYLGAVLLPFYGLLVPGRAGGPLRPLLAFLALGPLVLALAAVQLLPTFDLLREAPRKLIPEAMYEFSFHPARLLELVVPFAWGMELDGSPYVGGFLHETRSPAPWTRSIYVGLLPLLLAPLAFAERRTRRLALFCSVMALLALLGSFGRGALIYPLATRVLPLFDRFRVPSKLWILCTLGLAVLAALGAARLLEKRDRRPGLAALALAVLLLGAAVWPGTGALSMLGPAARLPLRSAALVGLALLAVARRGRAALPLLVAMHALDLGSAQGKVARYFGDPRTAPGEPVPAARAILARVQPADRPFRIWHDVSLVEARGYRPPEGMNTLEGRKYWDRQSLDWNHAWRFGLEEVGGYTVLQDGRPVALRRVLRERPEALGTALPRLGVLFLVQAGHLPVPAAAEAVGEAEGGAIRVVRLAGALPRVFLSRSAIAAEPADALLGLLTPELDPRAVSVVEDPAAAMPAGSHPGEGEARLLSWSPGRVEVGVDVPEPRLVVLAEARYRGWFAEVDGRRRETARANFLMQAVRVEPGEGRVVFRFLPDSYRLGRWISLAAWLLAGLFLAGYVSGTRIAP